MMWKQWTSPDSSVKCRELTKVAPRIVLFLFDQTLMFEDSGLPDYFTFNRKLPEAVNLSVWSTKFIAKCTPIDFLGKPLLWEDQGEQEGEDSDNNSHVQGSQGHLIGLKKGKAPWVNGDSTRSTVCSLWVVGSVGRPLVLSHPKLPVGFCFLNVIQNEQGWQWNVPGGGGRAPFCLLWGWRDTKARGNQASMGRR